MDAQELIDRLMADYRELCPQARAIDELLQRRGDRPRNDHIALRTFGDPRCGIDRVAAPFEAAGWQRADSYGFDAKGLDACHYEPPEAGLPKVFISQLRLDTLDEAGRAIVAGLLDHCPSDLDQDPAWPAIGRPWPIALADYEVLRAQSEYAAWLAAHGWRVNHGTIDVDSLDSVSDLAELNRLVAESGMRLNEQGGAIKGDPADGLQQSSTRAGNVPVAFSDGEVVVPGCYVEFAQRFPVGGRRFEGFITRSADRIFESTDHAPPVVGEDEHLDD